MAETSAERTGHSIKGNLDEIIEVVKMGFGYRDRVQRDII